MSQDMNGNGDEEAQYEATKNVLGVDPMRYDLSDRSDRDELHLMMNYADGLGYREVGSIEVLSREKIAFVRHGDDMWSGMSGDISWFVGAVKTELDGDSDE